MLSEVKLPVKCDHEQTEVLRGLDRCAVRSDHEVEGLLVTLGQRQVLSLATCQPHLPLLGPVRHHVRSALCSVPYLRDGGAGSQGCGVVHVSEDRCPRYSLQLLHQVRQPQREQGRGEHEAMGNTARNRWYPLRTPFTLAHAVRSRRKCKIHAAMRRGRQLDTFSRSIR